VIRRRVIVHGRVQGVFFRDTIRRRAEELGVSGWAANRPDGALEAAFEGEPKGVEALVELCHRGPSRAEVERVDVSEEEPAGERGFRIL